MSLKKIKKLYYVTFESNSSSSGLSEEVSDPEELSDSFHRTGNKDREICYKVDASGDEFCSVWQSSSAQCINGKAGMYSENSAKSGSK
jgi:hypothetical protein